MVCELFSIIKINVSAQREPGIDKTPAWHYILLVLLNFHCNHKILLVLHIKRSSFWPSVDAKPKSYDLVHAMLCGLYYKHMMIMNADSGIINKLGASLTDDARVIIYDCHMFIVQATGIACLFSL
jgi:hypothetical protein